MKNEIYDNMLSAYGATTEQERRNAIFEVNQAKPTESLLE